jgi:hypothetical protein
MGDSGEESIQDDATAEQEALRAVELADGYLDEAEDVLWTTVTEIESTDVGAELEEVTESIWDVQVQLYELRDHLEE